MTEHDPFLETPPTTEEIEGAHRLAEALESGTPGRADPHALSVVRFLQSLSVEASGDELASRRARRDLVARASRIRSQRVAGRFAAAAALVAVALSGALLLRSLGRPSEQVLAQREAAALEAVAAVSVSGTKDMVDARLLSHMDDLRMERFSSALRSERLITLLSQAEGKSSVKEGRGKSPLPTTTQDPGGAL